MAQVFLSWGAPDRAAAERISKFLRNAGLTVWDSIHDMQGGQTPHQAVLEQVAEAEVAIFLLSDAVRQRDWIVRELDWGFAEHQRRGRVQIIPLQVGPLSEYPALVRELHLHVDDVSSLDDADLNRLLGVVRSRLGLPEPLIVPVALYAMDLASFRRLRDDSWGKVAELCQSLGMPKPLTTELEARYGETANDFKPFGDMTLRSIVARMQYLANAERSATERPIAIQWCRDGLRAGDRKVVDLWSSNYSILFVDSLSLADDAIKLELLNLPWPEDRARSALVWIPPYSTHTARLQERIPETIDTIRWLQHAFDAFVELKDSRRSVTFDFSTPATLQHWLLRLLTQPLKERPSLMGVETMRRFQAPAIFSPRRDFNRGGTSHS